MGTESLRAPGVEGSVARLRSLLDEGFGHVDVDGRAILHAVPAEDLRAVLDELARARPQVLAIPRSRVVEVAEAPGTPGTGTRCAWGEFVDDNTDPLGSLDESVVPEVEEALLAEGVYHGGGGAAPEFWVRFASEEAWVRFASEEA